MTLQEFMEEHSIRRISYGKDGVTFFFKGSNEPMGIQEFHADSPFRKDFEAAT